MAVFQITPGVPGELWTQSGFPFITRTQWETINKIEDVEYRQEAYQGLTDDPARGAYILVGGLLYLASEAGTLLLIGRAGPYAKAATAMAWRLGQNRYVQLLTAKILWMAGRSVFQHWLNQFAYRYATRVVQVSAGSRAKAAVVKGSPKNWRSKLADGIETAIRNPISRTGAQSGQAILQTMRLNRLTPYDIKNFMEWLLQELPDRAKNKLSEFLQEQFEKENEMPYNRRTGQWYPARRRYGNSYNRGGYRRGGYSRGYTPRRRSYRRW